MPADSKAAPALAVQLLGRPGWLGADGMLVPLSRKDAALLALLGLDPAPQRARVAAWLWPDVPQATAHLNLRQRLFRLRRQTGHALWVADADAVRPAAGMRFDLLEWRASPIDRCPAEDADLLAGQPYDDGGALDEWVQTERARWRQWQIDRLSALALRYEADNAHAQAIALVQRVLVLAPLQEHGWRQLMRLHYWRGDRAAGLAAFERFERLLRDEWGGQPSGETMEQLRALEQLQHPGSVRLTGRPVAMPPTLTRPPRLVGREAERAAMNQAWADGRAFIVLGVAGMGKTRLLTEFSRDRPGVLFETARPGDECTPYASVRRLLAPLVARGLPKDSTARQELARLLPTLGPAPRTTGQQAVLWQAIEQVLIEGQRLGWSALVHDDLQYADRATQELLRWLVGSAALAEWRFAFGARPAQGDVKVQALPEWLGDSSRLVPVDLAPLTEGEVGELINSLQLHELQADALTGLLHQHAGGHPFFTLETLKEMVRTGVVGAPLPLPAGVATLIDHRLHDLPERASALMRVAALAGADMSLERAAGVLACHPAELVEPWSRLEAAGILKGNAFAHDLVQEAALRTVPVALRAPMHRLLAVQLASGLDVPAARVAGHWQKAGEWAKAAVARRAAAREAAHAGQLVEQMAHLDSAIECYTLAGDAGGSFDAGLEQLPAVIVRDGSLVALQRVAELVVHADSDERRLRLGLIEGEALFNLTRYGQALSCSGALMGLADRVPKWRAKAFSLHGRALAIHGQWDDALPLLEQARQLAAADGDDEQAQAALTALAHAQFMSGQLAQATLTQRAAQAAAHRLHDPAEIAASTGNLATMLFYIGDSAGAHGQACDAARLFKQLGSEGATHAGINALTRGRAAAHLGRIDEALASLDSAMRALGSAAGPTADGMARCAAAALQCWLGRPVQALNLLGATAPDAQPLTRAVWHCQHGMALQAAGRDCSADVAAVRALKQATPALAEDPILMVSHAGTGWRLGSAADLRRARLRCEAAGRSGMARSLAVCEIERRLATNPKSALPLARELLPTKGQGLYAGTFPVHAWTVLFKAFDAAGEVHAAAQCRRAAREWIAAAMPTISDASVREAFLRSELVHPFRTEAVTTG